MSFSEWKEVTLGDVIFFNPRETLIKGTVAKKIGMDKLEPFNKQIQGYEVTEFKSGTKFRNGDTLLARITPCLENGKTAQVRILDKNEVAFGSTEFIVMREKVNKTINDFIYYLAISEDFRNIAMKSMTGTSGRQRVQKDVLEKTVIKLPPLDEQKAIAHILSTLDEKIEINNKINKTLEKMAQTIFKHWFIDFEFPNENGEPYKSSGGEMVESELGMIPKGWEVDEIGNISEIQNGFAFKAPEYVNKGIKVLRTLNIGTNGYFENRNLVYLPLEYDNEKYAKYLFKKFDVALVMVGASIGKIGVILKNTENSLQNQNMWRFRTKKDYIPQLYLNYLVHEAQKTSSNWSTGSAREFYRKDSFAKIKVVIPKKEVLTSYNKRVNLIFSKISYLVLENEKLEKIRDLLSPKLMSGEIRVPLDKEGEIS